MAAGKPIIGAINGETARVIREAGCGLCCAAEDFHGLADSILRFTGCDEKEKMAAKAQEYYLRNYGKEQFLHGLEQELISLAEL